MQGENNLYLDELKKLQQSREIACIYTSRDTSKFAAGIIQCFDEKFVIIEHILPTGQYDGFVTRNIEDILKIEQNSKYSNKIKTLSNLYNVKHEKLKIVNQDVLFSLFTYAMETRKIVTLELVDSEYDDAVGYVDDVSGDFVRMTGIDRYGEKDGEIVFKTSNITHLDCGTDTEVALKLLNEIL